MEDKIVRVGVSIICANTEGHILLGKRKGWLNPGVYAPPGGKPDYLENPEDTARRELLEETGITYTGPLVQIAWNNNPFPQYNVHYVTLIYLADEIITQEPKNMEPDKNEGWKWYSLDKLPQPMWQGLENILLGHFKDVEIVKREE